VLLILREWRGCQKQCGFEDKTSGRKGSIEYMASPDHESLSLRLVYPAWFERKATISPRSLWAGKFVQKQFSMFLPSSPFPNTSTHRQICISTSAPFSCLSGSEEGASLSVWLGFRGGFGTPVTSYPPLPMFNVDSNVRVCETCRHLVSNVLSITVPRERS